MGKGADPSGPFSIWQGCRYGNWRSGARLKAGPKGTGSADSGQAAGISAFPCVRRASVVCERASATATGMSCKGMLRSRCLAALLRHPSPTVFGQTTEARKAQFPTPVHGPDWAQSHARSETRLTAGDPMSRARAPRTAREGARAPQMHASAASHGSSQGWKIGPRFHKRGCRGPCPAPPKKTCRVCT